MIDDIVPRAEEEALASIQKAVERAAADRDALNEAAEDRLVDLALLIARRVIAREVSLDPKIVRNLVREGVSALGERDRLVVRVGSFFAEMKDHLVSELSNGKVVCEIIVDPTLAATGCVVETDLGRVDESIETRLSNLIETLTFEARRKRK
jgi:flagellar assembly protein FliH